MPSYSTHWIGRSHCPCVTLDVCKDCAMKDDESKVQGTKPSTSMFGGSECMCSFLEMGSILTN